VRLCDSWFKDLPATGIVAHTRPWNHPYCFFEGKAPKGAPTNTLVCTRDGAFACSGLIMREWFGRIRNVPNDSIERLPVSFKSKEGEPALTHAS